MKPQELRIGNLIYWDIPQKINVIHEVVGVINDKPRTSPISLGDTINDYSSIPLTEEWLFNFGFFKCQGRHGEYFKHKTQGLFRVWHDPHTQSWAIGRKDLDRFDEKYNTCFIRNGVKTVHLFQNIFHCLTDEELIFKK